LELAPVVLPQVQLLVCLMVGLQGHVQHQTWVVVEGEHSRLPELVTQLAVLVMAQQDLNLAS
jgi:hypothetical protein